jgi:hypothetical protein
MLPRTITIASLAFLVLGLAAVGVATKRLADLDRESAGLLRAGREAGDTFVETLQGEHAERQLQAYDQRRAVALARGAARRDRLLGLLGVVAGGLGLAVASALRRIAAEIEEQRRPFDVDARRGAPAAGGRA